MSALPPPLLGGAEPTGVEHPRSGDEGFVFKLRCARGAYNNAVRYVKLEDVTFHTLRHTFASWAIIKGASLKELQELLWHASLTMTMRYAHLSPERLRSAVARLDELTSGVILAEVAPDRAQEQAHEPTALRKSA